MGDKKSAYSSNSATLTEHAHENDRTSRAYNKSRQKHDRYKSEWIKHPVNINEIVEKYAPNASGEVKGIKYIYRGDKHAVVADMASGSLRIYDSEAKKYISHNGDLSKKYADTHFYIKKREEM